MNNETRQPRYSRPEDNIFSKPAGENVQTWFCEECQEWHTGSVLGGPVDEAERTGWAQ